MAVVTHKVIRQELASTLGAETGTHYEKAWLKSEIDRVARAQLAGPSEAAAVEPSDPPPGDDDAMDIEGGGAAEEAAGEVDEEEV
jgi:hypothetical protein